MRSGNLREDSAGVAAIEFALVLPLLLIVFLGSITLFNAYRTGHALDRATATIADLMSRQKELPRSFLEDRVDRSLRNLVSTASFPSLRVTSLTRRSGEFHIDWSYRNAEGAASAEKPIPYASLPAVPEGDSVLLTETDLLHDMAFDVLGLGGFAHRTIVAVRPRFSRQITHTP